MPRSFPCPFFKTWNRDMAYVLGYWFADGNMYFQKGAGRYFVSIEGKKKACIAASLPNWCVAGTTGFEPAISTLTGSHPRPLDDVPQYVAW